MSSWNDTATTQSIIGFVARITRPGTPDFVAEPDRIAAFDNDGTLWPEAPVPFQAAYVFDELKRRTPDEPQLATGPIVQAALDGDIATLMAGAHHDGLMRVLALTHAGMTTEEFDSRVETWMASARHPRFGRRYDQLTFQPQQQLLAFLRANGFRTFIVSGGGADFMRVWTERVYGIPQSRWSARPGRSDTNCAKGSPN